MKEALIETLTERGNLFADVMVEAREDFALVEGIKEGEQTEEVSCCSVKLNRPYVFAVSNFGA